MAKSPEIRRGTAEQVAVNVVQSGQYRKWVVEFSLAGQRMFFVSNVDVSLLAENQPIVCEDGDEVIVSGSSRYFSIFTPSDRPKDGLFQAKAIHVVRTGKTFGDSGVLETYLGGVLTAVSVGLVIAFMSYLGSGGTLRTPGHLKFLYFVTSMLVIGGVMIAKGMPARANWKAAQSSAGVA